MTDSDDPLRMKLTFQIATIGIAAVVFSFLIALFVFSDADEPGQVIVAVLGPVVAVVGTLAGYVAGQTAGAAGKEQLEDRREKAEERARSAQQQLIAVAGASTDADLWARAKTQFPESFPAQAGSEQ
jgi:cell shape-determining protein MreC